MEMLLGKLASLLNGPAAQAASNQDKVQVAAAALLIHAMRIDDRTTDDELQQIRSGLQSHFGIGGAECDALVATAKAEDDAAIDLYRFTRVLNADLSLEDRQGFVRMLWEVVIADGDVNAVESNLVWRIAELLGVTTDDRVRLRQEVLAAARTA